MTQQERYQKYIIEQCINCSNKDTDLCEIRTIHKLDGTVTTGCEYYARYKKETKVGGG